MKLIAYKDLTQSQIREVKNQFVNRFIAIGKDKYYPTESDWMSNHAFYVRKDGHLSAKHNHCEPAWMVGMQ